MMLLKNDICNGTSSVTAMKWWLVFAFVFSLLSSFRLSYLPEFQVALVLIFGPWFSGRIKFSFAALLLCVFCTHFFAVPDAIYRFSSSDYPSIYTKTIGVVKYLDILVVILAFASLYNIRNASSIFIRKNYPFFLPLLLILGAMAQPLYLQDFTSLLFICRSFLLLVAIALIFSGFNVYEIKRLCILASFAWTTKMFCSILIPSENPLYREMLGLRFAVPFAGDEYLTLGVYAIIVLSVTGVAPKSSDSKFIKCLLFAAFFLCIVAQRKGAIQYFGFLLLIITWGNASSVKQKIVNIVLLVEPWLLFLFLGFVVPFLPDLARLAFFEYANLLSSATESLHRLFQDNYVAAVFGIGPTGLYEIHGLNPLSDNIFAFGTEVGAPYRFVISLPYGRLILNVGILGSLIYFVYLLVNMRQSSFKFYLYVTISGFFYFQMISPVAAIACGITFAVLPKILIANTAKIIREDRRLQNTSV